MTGTSNFNKDEQAWEDLKEDLKDEKYVEEFLSAALQMIFATPKKEVE